MGLGNCTNSLTHWLIESLNHWLIDSLTHKYVRLFPYKGRIRRWSYQWLARQIQKWERTVWLCLIFLKYFIPVDISYLTRGVYKRLRHAFLLSERVGNAWESDVHVCVMQWPWATFEFKDLRVRVELDLTWKSTWRRPRVYFFSLIFVGLCCLLTLCIIIYK